MLTVLYDYQHFSEQKYGGISRYFANIMTEIEARDDIKYKLAAVRSKNYYIRDVPLLLNNRTGDFFLKGKVKREIKWNSLYSKYLLKENDFDVFHPTYYHPYFLNYIKKPFVVTVHDMIHEKYPEVFNKHDMPVAAFKKQIVAKASKVIAISQSTKNDLIDILHVPEEKIEVIHHGIRLQEFKSVPLALDIPKDFILYVGDRNPYKNFNRFAEAMGEIMNKYKDVFLVCTGGARFTLDEVKLLTKLNIIHRCFRINVTDIELNALYQHALAFVFPSLYEGFGLPVLEAFQNNCPVIASNTSSLPEVCSDAAAYFNPNDTSAIAGAIDEVLNNTELKISLIKRGQERLMQFSIGNCINKTIELYKQVAL